MRDLGLLKVARIVFTRLTNVITRNTGLNMIVGKKGVTWLRLAGRIGFHTLGLITERVLTEYLELCPKKTLNAYAINSSVLCRHIFLVLTFLDDTCCQEMFGLC